MPKDAPPTGPATKTGKSPFGDQWEYVSTPPVQTTERPSLFVATPKGKGDLRGEFSMIKGLKEEQRRRQAGPVKRAFLGLKDFLFNG